MAVERISASIILDGQGFCSRLMSVAIRPMSTITTEVYAGTCWGDYAVSTLTVPSASRLAAAGASRDQHTRGNSRIEYNNCSVPSATRRLHQFRPHQGVGPSHSRAGHNAPGQWSNTSWPAAASAHVASASRSRAATRSGTARMSTTSPSQCSQEWNSLGASGNKVTRSALRCARACAAGRGHDERFRGEALAIGKASEITMSKRCDLIIFIGAPR